MKKVTITEALAEIKTIGKRLEKKREFVLNFLARQERFKDPHEKDGGSFQVIQQERQSIHDLESRVVFIRQAINKANAEIQLEVGGRVRTIAEWLVWRREVLPGHQQFLMGLSRQIASVRKEAQTKGVNVVAGDVKASADTDVHINLNEKELGAQIEEVETIVGNLDGQLSLKNATTFIELPE